MAEQPGGGQVEEPPSPPAALGPPAAPPAARPAALPLGMVVGAVIVVGAVFDLFCLLLLPFRLGGHLLPLAPVLVLALNAALGAAANWAATERTPARVLLGVAIVLSVAASFRGPGGDLLVTRDLQGMWLLFIVAACLGAGVPLFRKARSG